VIAAGPRARSNDRPPLVRCSIAHDHAKLTDMSDEIAVPATLRVTRPCCVSWRRMRGDDRVRFCGRCERNVYNLSAMTSGEMSALFKAHRMNMCVRFYQRADGTMVTGDCPPATRLERLKRRILDLGMPAPMVRAALWALGLILALTALFGSGNDRARLPFGGDSAETSTRAPHSLATKQLLMGLANSGDY
jgi:hypothetical protein